MNNLKKIRCFSLSWKIIIHSPSHINTIAEDDYQMLYPKVSIDELLGEREVGIIVFFVCNCMQIFSFVLEQPYENNMGKTGTCRKR